MIRVIALLLVLWLAVVVALGLGGCQTPGERPVIVREVPVPVAVKCAADAGPEPTYADNPAAILAAPDILARVKLVLAGRLQREARLAELRAANAGCAGP